MNSVNTCNKTDTGKTFKNMRGTPPETPKAQEKVNKKGGGNTKRGHTKISDQRTKTRQMSWEYKAGGM